MRVSTASPLGRVEPVLARGEPRRVAIVRDVQEVGLDAARGSGAGGRSRGWRRRGRRGRCWRWRSAPRARGTGRRSRVSTTSNPASRSRCASRRAIASVTSFSRTRRGPMAPGSWPPCPASTTMRRMRRGRTSSSVERRASGSGPHVAVGVGGAVGAAVGVAGPRSPRSPSSRVPTSMMRRGGSSRPKSWTLLAARQVEHDADRLRVVLRRADAVDLLARHVARHAPCRRATPAAGRARAGAGAPPPARARASATRPSARGRPRRACSRRSTRCGPRRRVPGPAPPECPERERGRRRPDVRERRLERRDRAATPPRRRRRRSRPRLGRAASRPGPAAPAASRRARSRAPSLRRPLGRSSPASRRMATASARASREPARPARAASVRARSRSASLADQR